MAGVSANLAMFDNWLFDISMCGTMVTSYEQT